MFKDLYAMIAFWFYSMAVWTDEHLAKNVYSWYPLSCMDVLYKQTQESHIIFVSNFEAGERGKNFWIIVFTLKLFQFFSCNI